MTTQFLAAAAAIQDLLESSPAVSAHIELGRVKPMPAEWSSLVNVLPVTSTRQPAAIYNAPQDWDTELQVICRARGLDDSPAELIDAIVLAAAGRIEAGKALGGIAMDLALTRIDWDFGENGDNTATATLNYTLQHRTDSQSLE